LPQALLPDFAKHYIPIEKTNFIKEMPEMSGAKSREKGIVGEEAVNQIAFHTYLKYWCYPNPKDELGNKNEICDLLILFKDVLILIAVKNYSFDGNYEKYFRSTLVKAQSQLQGAERKLFTSDRDIHFKHPDKGLIKFEKSQIKTVHRIIVNLNNTPLFYPGGLLTKNDDFIHVMNWDAFLRLVSELDTIPDFIQYLNTRADCFLKRTLVILTGKESDWDPETGKEFHQFMNGFNPTEKTIILVSGTELDLVADYFLHERSFSKEFYSNDYNEAFMQIDDNWDSYLARKEVRRKKEDDRVSYFVDEFLKNEVLYKTDELNLELATELLSLSRFERRILGKHFFQFWARYQNESGLFTARRFGKINDLTIGFFLYSEKMPHEMVMKLLGIAIEGYCVWDKYKSKKIIMIAVSNKLQGFRYGFLKDIQPFDKQHEEDLLHDLQVLKWFTKVENIVFTIKEYPDDKS
jgi:hypothetical protein